MCINHSDRGSNVPRTHGQRGHRAGRTNGEFSESRVDKREEEGKGATSRLAIASSRTVVWLAGSLAPSLAGLSLISAVIVESRTLDGERESNLTVAAKDISARLISRSIKRCDAGSLAEAPKFTRSRFQNAQSRIFSIRASTSGRQDC